MACEQLWPRLYASTRTQSCGLLSTEASPKRQRRPQWGRLKPSFITGICTRERKLLGRRQG